MDLLEVVGKIKLDASDYKQGLSEAEGASTKASSAISQAFTAIGQKINGAGSFISEFKAGFAEGMEEAVFETNKEANALGALKNRLEMAKNAVKASENEVARLAAEFNKSAKETGLDSEETQRLAQELDKAEKEMKDNQSELNKLEKELKEYGDAAEEASEKSSETGDKIKHAFGTVAKGGVEALKKAVEITAKAIAAAAAPAVLEVLRKYNGKPYGEKTRAKISEEVRQLCGCRFYIRDFSPYASEAGYLIPEDVPGVNRYGWGADDLTLYTTYDAATKSRPLLLDENNKINAAAAELLKLGYCAPYVEDACARAQEIEAARAALEDARTAYNTAVEKYNSLIPSTIKHQEQSNARF